VSQAALAILGVAFAVAIAMWLRSGLRAPTLSREYRSAIDRGSTHWQRVRRWTLALSLYRDPLFPWLRATEVHHLTYRRLRNELPWRDVVPLSHPTHVAITYLCRLGFRTPTTIVLRAVFGLWILTPPYLIALGASALGVVPHVPTPLDLAQLAITALADARHTVGAARDAMLHLWG
jgi:hypothetical protein